jgi:putative flippase GtrA
VIFLRQTLINKLNNKFFKFIIVGVLNTIFGYSIFALLVFFGLHYALAIFLATCLGVAFNFKTIGTFVFSNRDNSLIGRFVATYVVLCLLNIASLKVMMEIGFSSYVGGGVVLFPIALTGYYLNSKFVFVDIK